MKPVLEKKITGHVISGQNVYIEPYVFLPGNPALREPPYLFHGGVQKDTFGDTPRIIWGGTARDVPPSIKPVLGNSIPGRSLFAGPVWNHFGHIMTESIHRLWALKEAEYDQIVFCGVVGLRGITTHEQLRVSEVPAVLEKILRAMEIPEKSLVFVREPMAFDNLDVPEPGSRLMHGIEDFYIEHLKDYQSKISSRLKEFLGPRNLYYSRRHILNQGGVIGCGYFEDILTREGFHLVKPELLSIHEQLALLINAERVVFDQGSSLHMMEILGPLSGSFYGLPRAVPDRIFPSAFRKRAQFSYCVQNDNVAMLPDANGNLSTAALACYRRPDEIHAFLREHGLVSEPYDRKLYENYEIEDLERCPAKDKVYKEARLKQLKDICMARK